MIDVEREVQDPSVGPLWPVLTAQAISRANCSRCVNNGAGPCVAFDDPITTSNTLSVASFTPISGCHSHGRAEIGSLLPNGAVGDHTSADDARLITPRPP